MPVTTVSRRHLLLAAGHVVLTSPRAKAAPEAGAAGPQIGDGLVAVDDVSHVPLRPHDVRAGAGPIRAWPMQLQTGRIRNEARFNQLLLLRLPESTVAAGGSGALVAFTAICTHAGCVVADWNASTRRLHCPCHGSEFDPAQAGAVVNGPASLPLPMLPVRVTGGCVVVSGAFSGPVGGHTGRTD